ncbi:succinyl-CoA:coenzyme A transferase [bacterium BMS3Abin05]|nr:succinyl-CoA:coenzyme A transferase [bacterium BMS3Abin05]GBE27771.1 succinyl-CoA:coenzyme A transferase [bacterium BMS3Bbin03]
MGWIDPYRGKVVSPEEAVSVVKSGDRIYMSGNAATPYVLLDALAERKDELRDVELTHLLLLGKDPLSGPGMAGHFRHRSLFVGPADRKAVHEGRADYVPVFLNEIPGLFASGILPIDVAVVHTSRPDEHGFLSYGVETIATKAAVESAKVVIAQVNEKMPRVLGDAFVHISHVDRIVEVSEALPVLKSGDYSDVEKKIGYSIAELVEDGSTVQLGIGGIPNAVLFFLKSKRDLGIHTEMCSDGMMEAIESGVVTGAKKTLHREKVIATLVMGTKKLYDFVDNNPIFELHPVSYTNDPFIIAQNDKMVAVNSALEIDLTGQVCSDSIGYRIYSGFGGQVDFIRGAARSKGGKPVIALRSTAKENSISRIVPHLREGAGVVTSRGDVHYVVTEYGTAYLHGKSIRERAEALIGIAHPDFQESLLKFAKERHYIS